MRLCRGGLGLAQIGMRSFVMMCIRMITLWLEAIRRSRLRFTIVVWKRKRRIFAEVKRRRAEEGAKRGGSVAERQKRRVNHEKNALARQGLRKGVL